MTKQLCLNLMASLVLHAQWQPLPPLPAPNGGCTCAVLDGRILIAGGTNWEGGRKHWLREVHAYEPKSGQWQSLPPLPAAQAYGLGASVGAEVWMLGGSDGSQALTSLMRLGARGIEVKPLADAPKAMVLLSGAALAGDLYFAGGSDDAANLEGLSAAALVLHEGRLQRLPDVPCGPLAVAASAAAGGQWMLFGGMQYDAAAKVPVNSARAFSYSPRLKAWRGLADLPTPTRGLSALALDDERVYLAGGFNEGFSAQAWIYHLKSNRYAAAKALPYAAMVGLVLCEGQVYCIGGEDKMKSRSNQFWRIAVEELAKP